MDTQHLVPVLVFNVAQRLYALLVEDIVEVVSMVALISVNDAPEGVIGVVNRHGDVLPLVDMRRVMVPEAEDRPVDSNTLFVVAEANGRLLGLVVDEVEQVAYYPRERLRRSAGGRFIRGMITSDDRIIQVIAAQALIDYYAAQMDDRHGERT